MLSGAPVENRAITADQAVNNQIHRHIYQVQNAAELSDSAAHQVQVTSA